MVDPISGIQFEVCGKENHQKESIILDFCTENPMEEGDGREDFSDEDILDIELRAWKIFFDVVVNQYRKGIGVLLITLEGSHIPLAFKLNFKVTNNMAKYEACNQNGSSPRIGGE